MQFMPITCSKVEYKAWEGFCTALRHGVTPITKKPPHCPRLASYPLIFAFLSHPMNRSPAQKTAVKPGAIGADFSYVSHTASGGCAQKLSQ